MMSGATYDARDLRYMQSLASAVVQRSPRYLMMTLVMVAIAVISAIVWMGFAKTDIVVRGTGKVIPSQKLQVVQSLEGGVVSEILVHEGDLVNVSQPLIKISDVAFASSFGENRLRLLELRANIARLKAEANDAPFEADEVVAKEAPDQLRAARELYESQKRELEQSHQILEEQVRLPPEVEGLRMVRALPVDGRADLDGLREVSGPERLHRNLSPHLRVQGGHAGRVRVRRADRPSEPGALARGTG